MVNQVKMNVSKKARLDKRQTKKDSGVAIVDAPMSTGKTVSFPMREEIRDILNKRPHPSDVKKPLHPDLMTTAEREEHKFSGFFRNDLKGVVELWFDGKILGTERADRVARNPSLLADLLERTCMSTGVVVAADFDVYTAHKAEAEDKDKGKPH